MNNQSPVNPAAIEAYAKAQEKGIDALTKEELLIDTNADEFSSTVAHVLAYEGKVVDNPDILSTKNGAGVSVQALYKYYVKTQAEEEKAERLSNRSNMRKGLSFFGDSIIGRTDGKFNPAIAFRKFSVDTGPITKTIPKAKELNPKNIYKTLQKAKKYKSHDELLDAWGLKEKGEPNTKLIQKVIKVHKLYLVILSVFAIVLLVAAVKNMGAYTSYLSLVMFGISLLYCLPIFYRFDTLRNKKHFTFIEWFRSEMSFK